MWFEALTNFREESPKQVRENMSVEGNILKSHINGKKYVCGLLETPSLAELRDRVNHSKSHSGKISVREKIANVQQLHIDESNAGSLFPLTARLMKATMLINIGDYRCQTLNGPYKAERSVIKMRVKNLACQKKKCLMQ